MPSNDQSTPFDTLAFIMEWEGGGMDVEQEAIGFQHLLDSGFFRNVTGDVVSNSWMRV